MAKWSKYHQKFNFLCYFYFSLAHRINGRRIQRQFNLGALFSETAMHRRSFILTALLLPVTASAQGLPAAGILIEVAQALGEAGEALSKITKGFRDLVKAGSDGYSYVAVTREKKRLLDLSARLTQFRSQKQIMVVNEIESYLTSAERYLKKNNQPASAADLKDEWAHIAGFINTALVGISALLADVKEERSDFVLENSYRQLIELMSSRAQLLSRLQAIQAPTSKQDLDALRRVNEKYVILLNAQTEAIEAMNSYIKALQK